jgi:uncharacterized protein YggU (UPF0235/DUF167 family)
MRFEIHVRPGASKTAVGGDYDGALVVRVSEPANSGRATAAALVAVAEALAVPRGTVTLVRGATSRRKLIEIELGADESDAVDVRLQSLRSPRD